MLKRVCEIIFAISSKIRNFATQNGGYTDILCRRAIAVAST